MQGHTDLVRRLGDLARGDTSLLELTSSRYQCFVCKQPFFEHLDCYRECLSDFNMPRCDRGGTSRGTGVWCVAANCGNTNVDGFSIHSFPMNVSISILTILCMTVCG